VATQFVALSQSRRRYSRIQCVFTQPHAVAHSRKNFEAFTTAGGKGTFKTFALEPGVNGHMLVAQQGLWGPAVEAYLAK
jgi:hypothetical protein